MSALFLAVASFSGSVPFARKAEREGESWVHVGGGRAEFEECRRLLAEDVLPAQGRGKATHGKITYAFVEREQLYWLRTDLTAQYEGKTPQEGKTVRWPFGCVADSDGRVRVFVGWESSLTGELY